MSKILSDRRFTNRAKFTDTIIIERQYQTFKAIAFGATFRSQADKYNVPVETIQRNLNATLRYIWMFIRNRERDCSTKILNTMPYFYSLSAVRAIPVFYCNEARYVKTVLMARLEAHDVQLTPEQFHALYEGYNPPREHIAIQVKDVPALKLLTTSLATLPIKKE